jgi:glycosyltransferase involved in cell wall biosynthesis
VQLAFDEQIFAIQAYGGISRMFSELARQYVQDPSLGVELEPLRAPIVNRYILDSPEVTAALQVQEAGSTYQALARYFTRRRPSVHVDVVHNTFYLPHGLAGYPKAKRVVTIHDMIPERMPKTRRRLDFITRKHRYVELADHVICVSAATRDDLLRTYPSVTAPITVVHHGVDPVFTPGAPRWADLPADYVLFVGNRSQYKDAAVLLRAFSTIARDYPDLTLLFIGGGRFTRAETALIRELALQPRVQQRTVPDAEMSAAYGNARMCVFPSRFEGFGLPALEAMACGTPTVLARATSLPEVGGEAAAYFEPGHAAELATIMRSILDDVHEAARLSAAGVARATQFSWGRSASETAAVYESTLK